MIDHVLALPEGYSLQEYTIRGTLGFGGFGITYEAHDTNLDKIVAIKEYLPSELAVRVEGSTVAARSDQDREGFEWGRQRFLDEARTVARFDHPNIIRIYRFFEQNGTGYIVMEYIAGRPLSAVLSEQGTLEEAEIHAWLWPILDGLKVVHQANFLHRDIKPHNIMIRNDGNPVLLDFGAARAAVSGHTRSLTSILTPGYAPLEQYQSRGNQGPWTDIYSLGAVVYCCMAGKKPVDALDRVIEDELEAPDAGAVRSYSPALVNGVMAALRVREDERPQNIEQWMAILKDHGSGPTRLMRPGPEASEIEPGSEGTTEASRDNSTNEDTTPGKKSRTRLIVAVPLFLGLVAAAMWLVENMQRSPGDSPTPAPSVAIDPPAQSTDTALPPDQGQDLESGTSVEVVTGEDPAIEESSLGQATAEHPPAEESASATAPPDNPTPQIPPARYALTIEPDPADAGIRFLNINEAYRPGISLEPGRYEIEVSRNGYQSVTRTLEIFDQARTIPIALRPLQVSQPVEASPQPVEASPQPIDDTPSLVIVTSCDDKQPTRSVSPVYPQRALSQGIEGRVTLEFTVDSDGSVVDPKVRTAEPAGLFEDAALDAIKQFRYRPNTFGGQDHPCLSTQEIHFQPKNAGS
jgi:TonB family protein